jgi:WD40 repeat protein
MRTCRHMEEKWAKRQNTLRLALHDAVLSLSHDRLGYLRGNANRTVKLWDLSRDRKEGAFPNFEKLHEDKVYAVLCSPVERLFSGWKAGSSVKSLKQRKSDTMCSVRPARLGSNSCYYCFAR